MNNTLLITIFILILITILFILVSINQKKVSKIRTKKILKRLEELNMGVVSNELSIRRDSIIKLDNLLSKSLQYYYNNSLLCGDNLKNAKNIFKKKEYNNLWEAHKVRNKIVHDDYEVSAEEAKVVYNTYKISILKILR